MSYTSSRSARKKRPARSSSSRVAGSHSSSSRARRAGRKTSTDDFAITESTGNVFLDVGFPPQQANELLIRSELMTRVIELLRRRKMTQVRAAKLLGVTQPRISDLMRGKIEKFSIDGLIGMLVRAGMVITVQVRPAA